MDILASWIDDVESGATIPGRLHPDWVCRRGGWSRGYNGPIPNSACRDLPVNSPTSSSLAAIMDTLEDVRVDRTKRFVWKTVKMSIGPGSWRGRRAPWCSASASRRSPGSHMPHSDLPAAEQAFRFLGLRAITPGGRAMAAPAGVTRAGVERCCCSQNSPGCCPTLLAEDRAVDRMIRRAHPSRQPRRALAADRAAEPLGTRRPDEEVVDEEGQDEQNDGQSHDLNHAPGEPVFQLCQILPDGG